jgi:hypothetical protein
MHERQLAVSAVQVRALVGRQFPRWRNLPVRKVISAGTVNAIFRIGEHYAARFPLQPMAPDAVLAWLRAEADAASELAGRTRFPTPEPVAIGEPGEGYPLPWALQTWLDGIVATAEDPGASVPFAPASPSSSAASGQSTPAGGPSGATAEVVTCALTMNGWRRASGIATDCWTLPASAGCGRNSGRCRGLRRM